MPPNPVSSTGQSPATQLLTVAWDPAASSFVFAINLWLVSAIVFLALVVLLWKWRFGDFTFKNFEIDQAELGIGNSKFRFKPNLNDKQVAYAIWIELSTRKIGLPIDFEHDVIFEIYDSWFNFFSVTRDLVKGVPVNQVKRDSTQAIINLSIDVLNQGLRPHLTQWQARFRRWYEREIKRYDNDLNSESIDPQQIQIKYPQYEKLKEDMSRVNHALILYRQKMYELVMKD